MQVSRLICPPASWLGRPTLLAWPMLCLQRSPPTPLTTWPTRTPPRCPACSIRLLAHGTPSVSCWMPSCAPGLGGEAGRSRGCPAACAHPTSPPLHPTPHPRLWAPATGWSAPRASPRTRWWASVPPTSCSPPTNATSWRPTVGLGGGGVHSRLGPPSMHASTPAASGGWHCLVPRCRGALGAARTLRPIAHPGLPTLWPAWPAPPAFAGFVWDSSISEQYPSVTSPSAAERLWPYTMDYGLPQASAARRLHHANKGGAALSWHAHSAAVSPTFCGP